MSEQFKNIKWGDLVANFLTIAAPLVTVMLIGIMNIRSDQAVLASKMDAALVRQKGLEVSVAQVLTEQSSIKANLLNYTDRLKTLEARTVIVEMLHQRVVNNDSRITRMEAEINNLRSRKLFEQLNAD
jgi:hypothetical protein